MIVDFHQDGYSKEIGEDGAPLWAIHPPPDMLLEGPLGGSLSERIVSEQVQRAYTSFFVDDDADTEDVRLQAAFAAMARHVATRFADEPFGRRLGDLDGDALQVVDGLLDGACDAGFALGETGSKPPYISMN